ncbi:anti-sigma factor domain-containing protein [Naasia sp. SYSU D00948]|uniref:anti-sigma factor n=1 Tax=Naasia sp. SYSU D00948 TaxID=2817379 RepID=UPI001B305E4D|nr:anti-sigma factor [Naasia sp. SYSU D00948]
MMSREQLHHLSGAYVLNALDEDERRAFEGCLAKWEDMRSEVTELADTAAALGLAVPPLAPDPAVREQLLARVTETPQQPRVRTRDVAPRRRALRLAQRAGAGPARGTPILWVSAALATVLLVLAVVTSVVPSPRDTGVTLAQLESAGDARRVPVPLAGGEGVELLWSDQLETSALIWESLPPLDEGTVYELWYLDESARPAGLVDEGTPGSKVLEGRLRPGDLVGITVEPAGGSEQPTSAPLVVIERA